MSNAVMQNQGNLLSGLDYLQQGRCHVRPTARDKMKNLITYRKNMNVEYKVNTMLDMPTQDGSPGHIHVQLVYRIEMKSSKMQSSNQMRNQAVSKN